MYCIVCLCVGTYIQAEQTNNVLHFRAEGRCLHQVLHYRTRRKNCGGAKQFAHILGLQERNLRRMVCFMKVALMPSYLSCELPGHDSQIDII